MRRSLDNGSVVMHAGKIIILIVSLTPDKHGVYHCLSYHPKVVKSTVSNQDKLNKGLIPHDRGGYLVSRWHSQ